MLSSYLTSLILNMKGESTKDELIDELITNEYAKNYFEVNYDEEGHIISNLDDYLLDIKKFLEESPDADWPKQKKQNVCRKIDNILGSKLTKTTDEIDKMLRSKFTDDKHPESKESEVETYADWKRAPAGTTVDDGYGWTLKLTNDSYLSSFTNDGYFGDDFIAKNFIMDVDDYEDDDDIDGDVYLGDGTVDKSEIWDIIFQNYDYPEEPEEDEEFEEDYGISVKRALELIDELYAIHKKGSID